MPLLYCMRGEMENRIKGQQLCLFADRTSCHRFIANHFRLLLSIIRIRTVRRFNVRLLSLVPKKLECVLDTIRLRIHQNRRKGTRQLSTCGFPSRKPLPVRAAFQKRDDSPMSDRVMHF